MRADDPRIDVENFNAQHPTLNAQRPRRGDRFSNVQAILDAFLGRWGLGVVRPPRPRSAARAGRVVNSTAAKGLWDDCGPNLQEVSSPVEVWSVLPRDASTARGPASPAERMLPMNRLPTESF